MFSNDLFENELSKCGWNNVPVSFILADIVYINIELFCLIGIKEKGIKLQVFFITIF